MGEGNRRPSARRGLLLCTNHATVGLGRFGRTFFQGGQCLQPTYCPADEARADALVLHAIADPRPKAHRHATRNILYCIVLYCLVLYCIVSLL